MTYNVHRCVGLDGRMDVRRIAAVIAESQPDIVALQELDVGRARTQGVDQAHAIADLLGMAFHFHAALKVEEELYGDALLTMYPERLVQAGPLPGLPTLPRLEPRGALWVEVATGDGTLQVINTHLGLLARERIAQVEVLLGPAWLGHPHCRDAPAVLLGDFNAVSRSGAYKLLSRRLRDAQGPSPRRGPRPTFPARWPLLRIHHVFLGEGVEALGAEVLRGPAERAASDHLPLAVDIAVRASAGRR